MIAGFHLEVVLSSGYALFLIAVAFCLEMLARHSLRRSNGLELAGFRFRPEADHWECPTGTRLPRWETDPGRRVVRYRAPAHVCNGCCVKSRCTDSDEGRLIERPFDPWLESGIRRFHRGISLALLFLAVLILIAEFVSYALPSDRLLLSAFLASIGVFAARLVPEFWAS